MAKPPTRLLRSSLLPTQPAPSPSPSSAPDIPSTTHSSNPTPSLSISKPQRRIVQALQAHNASCLQGMAAAASLGSSSAGGLDTIGEATLQVSNADSVEFSSSRSGEGVGFEPEELPDCSSLLKAAAEGCPISAPEVFDQMPERDLDAMEANAAHPAALDKAIEVSPARNTSTGSSAQREEGVHRVGAPSTRLNVAKFQGTTLCDRGTREEAEGSCSEPILPATLWRAGVEAGRELDAMAALQSGRVSPSACRP